MQNTSNGNRGNLVTRVLHTDATNKELMTSARDIIACLYAREKTKLLTDLVLDIEERLKGTDDAIEVDLNPGTPSVFSMGYETESDEVRTADLNISAGVSVDLVAAVDENNNDSCRFVGPLYTAKELQIATTHTLVSLMVRPGVSDEVRLKAALAVSGGIEHCATAPEVK